MTIDNMTDNFQSAAIIVLALALIVHMARSKS